MNVLCIKNILFLPHHFSDGVLWCSFPIDQNSLHMYVTSCRFEKIPFWSTKRPNDHVPIRLSEPLTFCTCCMVYEPRRDRSEPSLAA